MNWEKFGSTKFKNPDFESVNALGKSYVQI